ncbi:MAG: MBL fold metallo-hydrolase [Thermoanaerobaculia bacterium]
MLFERIEDPGLAHYSYAVGCPEAGSLAIVDPRRDVDVYLELAAARDLRITHVLETHIHADYASGARELAQRSGAEHLVSAYDAGETYEARFPHRDLADGDGVEIGSLRLAAVHTPGHTPEHLSFLVYDKTRSDSVPTRMLSGDFLFVGSLGRPDLLGEEAKRELAERLFDSVRSRLTGLPDALEIHPAHGAGSMCGAGMSGEPSSTLGIQRLANPHLDPRLTREEFVDRILSTTPPFPDYYRRMKQLNADGPPMLDGLPGLVPLSIEAFAASIDDGETLMIDVRDPRAFSSGHIPGSFAIGVGNSLSTWASWVVPYDRPILLAASHPDDVEPAVRALVRVGLDDVRGYLDGGVQAWAAAGRPLAELPQISVGALHGKLAAGEPVHVLDVRGDDEWTGGHIAGAQHLMGGYLPRRVDDVPDDGRPIVVTCRTGYRSTVAASVLERAGRRRVLNLDGGMRAWTRAGLPVDAP